MNIGQKVKTKFGYGIIIGFEVIDPSCRSITIVNTDRGDTYSDRIIVMHDEPNTWNPTEKTPNPYMVRSDIEIIEE